MAQALPASQDELAAASDHELSMMVGEEASTGFEVETSLGFVLGAGARASSTERRGGMSRPAI